MTLNPEQKRSLAKVFEGHPRIKLSKHGLSQLEDAVADKMKWWKNEKYTTDLYFQAPRAKVKAEINALHKALKDLPCNTEALLGWYSSFTQTYKLLEASNVTVSFNIFAEQFLKNYGGPRFNEVAGVTLLGAACRLVYEACDLAKQGKLPLHDPDPRPIEDALTPRTGRKPDVKVIALVTNLAATYEDITGRKASDKTDGPFYNLVNAAYKIINTNHRDRVISRKLIRSALLLLPTFKSALAVRKDEEKYIDM